MAGGRIEIEIVPDTRGFPGKVASGLKGLQGIAGTIGKGLGVAVAAGAATAAIGLKNVIDIGIDYQSKLNELQAVSGATALQMAQIGQTAKALGADLSLPATSAAGAAAAMLELAKGGLSVDQAMKAAKGTLQLAAAAQIDAASAAEIQSNALNQFGLSADQATKVADVLANTANAASGSIGDIALALKYVGPVAKSVGVSIGDTATAIGLLANKGIQADQAGTSLRAMLAGLAAPSKPAAKALKQLGIDAFDSSGKFVGFRTVIDQLNKAQKTMTQEQFASASATAFGREPLAAIVALAESGAPAFDEMATAVNRQGGAADVAAAKMRGLGGAWEGFKSQLETTGIEIFESIDGPLESIVRRGSQFVSDFTPKIKKGLDGAIAAGQLFGPELARSIESRASALGEVASRLLGPLVQGVKETLTNGLEIGIRSVQDFADVVRRGVDAVEPLAKGIGHVVESVNRADGPIGAFGAALGIAYDIVKGLIGVVAPVISLVAGLVNGFGDLPGPIQAAAIAILALKVGPSILSTLRGALSGTGKDAGDAAEKTGLLGKAFGLVSAPVKLVASGLSSASGAVRQFAGDVQLQQALAKQSGEEVTKLGAAYSTVQARVGAATQGFRDQAAAIREGSRSLSETGEPISRTSAAIGVLVERSATLSSAKQAFIDASSGAERFGRTAGTAAAAGSLLKSAGTGLVSTLGGPFGVVLGVATLGLGLLAGKQEEAAREAEKHKRDVSTLAGALRDSNGVIDDHIRKMQAEALQSDGVADKFKEQGVSLTTLTAATLKQGVEYDNLHQKLENLVKANSLGFDVDPESGNVTEVFNERGKAAQELIKVLEGYGAKTDEARQKEKELDAAIKNGTASALEATDSGRSFADAMGRLADRTGSADDKARALKQALDALSGGQVSLEASQARVNEQFDRLGDTFGKDIDKAKGFGNALLTSGGHINTATENGRKLRDSLDEIVTSTVEVAQKQFDMTGSLTDAQKVVQESRDRFIAMADKMGVSKDAAAKLADQMGLIPEQVVTVIQTPGMPESQREMVLLQGLIARTPGQKDVVVRSLTDDAKRQLEDFGFKVKTLPDGQISVHADTDQASRNLNNWIAANNGRAIHIFADVVGPARNMLGGRVVNHDGNILGFARGGLAGLTPMKGGVASIVPPNTWRVIGDRMRDREAYIPINQSNRSIALLQETADMMGFALLKRFATGGIAVSGGTQTAQSGPVIQAGGDTFNIFEQSDPHATAINVSRLQTFNSRLR